MGETALVTLATRFLEGEAASWWDLVRAGYPTQVSWTDFLREFRERYPSPGTRDRMATDYYLLMQGDRTVSEFSAELRRLHRVLAPDERSVGYLRHRFMTGLSPEVRAMLGTDLPEDFSTLVGAAVRAERLITRSRSRRRSSRDSRTRRSPSKGHQAQDGDGQVGSAARTRQFRPRRSVSQVPGTEPEATFGIPVVGSADRVHGSLDRSGQRQTGDQPATVRPSGQWMRGPSWRPPYGASSRSGTPSTREIGEVPPPESRFHFGFPAVYRAEHHSYEEVSPLFRTQFPLPQTGGSSRQPAGEAQDSNSDDNDPSEKL